MPLAVSLLLSWTSQTYTLRTGTSVWRQQRNCLFPQASPSQPRLLVYWQGTDWGNGGPLFNKWNATNADLFDSIPPILGEGLPCGGRCVRRECQREDLCPHRPYRFFQCSCCKRLPCQWFSHPLACNTSIYWAPAVFQALHWSVLPKQREAGWLI